MARPVVLENFFENRAPGARKVAVAEETEEQKLEAFENGYKAGWDDASASASDENARLAADLAGNLRDLAFTFEEARVHVLTGLEPVLREMLNRILPEVAKNTLPALVVERLEKAIDDNSARPVHLTVAPDCRAAVETMLPAECGFPIEVHEEETLTAGQAYLRLGKGEQQIDLTEAMQDIESLIADFFATTERLAEHG